MFCTKLRKYSQLHTKHDFFKNSFFPLTLKGRNNLDPHIRKFRSISIFKSSISKFKRPKPNNVYYFHNPKGIRLLTKLRLRLSHLCKHKFKHSFQDCLNLLCFCGNEIETSTHYLLHSPTYTNKRMTLLNKIKSINCRMLEFSDIIVTKSLIFGDNTLSDSCNTLILDSTIDRFDDSILTPG